MKKKITPVFEVQEMSDKTDNQMFPFRYIFNLGDKKFKITGKVDRSHRFQCEAKLHMFNKDKCEFNVIEAMLSSEFEKVSNGDWSNGPCPADKYSGYRGQQPLMVQNIKNYLVKRAQSYA